MAALYGIYLFLAQGRRLTSEDDSEFLCTFFKENCNAIIQLNRWRQTSASLSREFIDDRFLVAGRHLAVGIGHSSAVARKHYGQDYDTPAFATSDILYEQSWVDSEFHALLGFGSKSPPVALRHRKSNEATIQEIVRAELKDVRQGIVQDVLEGLGDIIKREVSLLVSKNPAMMTLPPPLPYAHLSSPSIPVSESPLPPPLPYTSHAHLSSPSVPDSEPPPHISRPLKGTPSNEEPSDFEMNYLSPSSPISPNNNILAAVQALYGPETCPKSDDQYRLCKEVVQKEWNIVTILPTASGKSAAWLVPAMMDSLFTKLIVVIVPFKQLLKQHLATALGHKLNAEHWTASMGTNVALSTSILFVACESIQYGFSK